MVSHFCNCYAPIAPFREIVSFFRGVSKSDKNSVKQLNSIPIRFLSRGLGGSNSPQSFLSKGNVPQNTSTKKGHPQMFAKGVTPCTTSRQPASQITHLHKSLSKRRYLKRQQFATNQAPKIESICTKLWCCHDTTRTLTDKTQ